MYLGRVCFGHTAFLSNQYDRDGTGCQWRTTASFDMEARQFEGLHYVVRPLRHCRAARDANQGSQCRCLSWPKSRVRRRNSESARLALSGMGRAAGRRRGIGHMIERHRTRKDKPGPPCGLLQAGSGRMMKRQSPEVAHSSRALDGARAWKGRGQCVCEHVMAVAVLADSAHPFE